MGNFPLDEEAVRKLAAILEETGLSEIEVEAEGRRIRVGKAAPAAAPMMSPMAQPPAPSTNSGEAPCSAAPAPATTAEGVVPSPMVGTAYVAAEPGAPPFVKTGDSVREGQTILIVEAMKVMNAIPAPRSGTVREVLVQDGQPVEFGEPLMIIS